MSKYRLRLNNRICQFPTVDGNGLLSYQGELINIGGWDASRTPASHSQFWASGDGGVNWYLKTTGPWPGMHTFGHGVRADGKIWLWGGDVDTINRRQVFTWDPVDGHQTITTNWGNGPGDRLVYSYCIHKDYMYVGLGQTGFGPTGPFNNDFYRSADGITWDFVSNAPAGMQNRSTAPMISDGTNLYIISGAIYDSPHYTFYPDMWKSTDDGVTWTQVLVDNRLLSIYPNACMFDGKLFFLKGYHNNDNQQGIYIIDLNTFQMESMNYVVPKRHASGMWTHDDELYIVAGNYNGGGCRNDSYKVVKLG